jgi:putative Holliday junction resolvase
MSVAGPVLGLDFGTRRIGLAVSDRDARLAFPAGCLESQGTEKDLQALCALVEKREITRIVVGLPIHMDGRAGPEADAARAFARGVAEATGLPVEMLDERWTTLEAERALAEIGGRKRGGAARAASRKGQRPRSEPQASGGRKASRAKSRGDVDAVAATILLRTYLERCDKGALS